MKKADGFFYKTFLRKNLLSPTCVIAERVDQINSFEYQKYKALARTEITLDGDEYSYKQVFHRPQKHQANKAEILLLADALEYLANIGFVHGDINRKNVIYTQEGFKIIDFEPDLFQCKGNRAQMMFTVPYVAKCDVERNAISTLTDKIGFIYFLLRISGKFSAKDIVMLSKDFDHKPYLKVDEKDLLSISYKNLVDQYLI